MSEESRCLEKPSLELLEQAVKEFKEKPHTSEVVTEYWRTLWSIWGKKVGLSLTIPACDRTAQEIEQLEEEGRKLVYVPDELANQENRRLLARIFLDLQPSSVTINSVTNESSQGGWFDIEASPDSPNMNTKEEDLKTQFKKQGKVGQRVNTYIVGSQDAKLQAGHFFDEDTISRLLGSHSEKSVVLARFSERGHLFVDWRLRPQESGSLLGGRSEGVKKV